jgi:site-specific DNA recombinase
MSRAPFGYEIKNNKLVPAVNADLVEKIYEEYLNTELSLNQLSKKYLLSLNGLKKVLTNFTYIGKIKFDGEVHEGKHKPLVSSTLFNHVQDKLEKTLGKRKK